jgi:signal transduction histidine kinase
MSPRTAKTISRTILGLAVIGIVATGIAALTVFDDAEHGRVVVIPADRQPAIAAAAAGLDPEDDCAPTDDVPFDPALGDAPSVYCDLQARSAEGAPLVPRGASPVSIVVLSVSILWLYTGGLIVSRQPRNAAGWILLLVGSCLIAEVVSASWVFVGIKAAPGSVPFVGAVALVTEYALVALISIPMLWLYFPDGRLPGPRWRWPVRIYAAASVLAFLAAVLTPGPLNNVVDLGLVYLNPLGIASLAEIAGTLQGAGVLTALVITVATMFGVRGRHRRAQGEERQQLRWLRFVTTLAIGSLVMMYVTGIGLSTVLGDDEPRVEWWFTTWFAITVLTVGIGIPAAYLIAILKHGLWNLDVVIRKTVQAAVIVAAMALVSVVVIVGIPALVLGSAADEDFWLVVALASLLAAAFTWIRGPARRIADRIVYGTRATPYEVLTEFSGQVGETYASEDVLTRMATVLGEGTGAEAASVWLRLDDGFRPDATWPSEEPPPETLPGDAVEVRHQGAVLGALSVRMPASDPIDPSRQALISDLASQAGLVLRNVRLIEELRASRQRLVAAQDEERRRLERNIHDGAQQQLVALQVRQRLAARLVERDPVKAVALLEQLQEQTGQALDELRDLARGIYPPLLADRGLTAAIEAQARRAAVPTEVLTEGVGRYGHDVEAAVYFSVLEALNNVAKYAGATRAQISLAQKDGSLSFAVRDDGRGFDPSAVGYGTGLQGIADRLDAIGGTFVVESTPGGGTRLSGRVPAVPA